MRNKLKKILKIILRPIIGFLKVVGFNPYRLLSLSYLLRYQRDRSEWLRCGGKITHTFPVLSNFNDSAGSVTGHYFQITQLDI